MFSQYMCSNDLVYLNAQLWKKVANTHTPDCFTLFRLGKKDFTKITKDHLIPVFIMKLRNFSHGELSNYSAFEMKARHFSHGKFINIPTLKMKVGTFNMEKWYVK